ncbi:hypothetical protein C8J57DRAFT_1255896 [Mycena rebaudengoi]|nr:hypothetical protein C8J57DRAFT_1255896 [Mycena rebaudengoi]
MSPVASIVHWIWCSFLGNHGKIAITGSPATEHAEGGFKNIGARFWSTTTEPGARFSVEQDSHSELCFTAPLGGMVGGIVTFSDCFGSAERPESNQQNFTFAAGSSSVGKGAPGTITVDLTGAPCLDVVTQTTNNTSVDYLGIRPCNGSLTQQWQVNNDSTINLANTNRCISGAIVPKTKLQIVDCIPGNVNQTWTIVQEISNTPSF